MNKLRRLPALLLALVLVFCLAACAVSGQDIADAVQLAAAMLAETEGDPALDQETPAQAAEPEAEIEAGAEAAPEPAAATEPEPEPEPEIGEEAEAAAEPEPEPEAPAASIDEDGLYTSKEDVALYLHLYGKLPANFITKTEARELGWSGGGLDGYADGKSIGGDRFGNYEGILPDGSYHECDIDTMHASSRGAKRLVYSEDGRIYYTEDHYESFELLYGEE